MFNYVVFPQIQQNKDCNILNSLSNSAAYISQAKKSIKQPNIKSILHMTNKMIACLWKSTLQLWTSMETQRWKTPSWTGSCDISLSLPHPFFKRESATFSLAHIYWCTHLQDLHQDLKKLFPSHTFKLSLIWHNLLFQKQNCCINLTVHHLVSDLSYFLLPF